MNGGPCFLTTNPYFAEENDGDKIIAVSKEDQEKAYEQGIDLAIARFNDIN